MVNIQRVGAYAAFTNAFLGLAMLIVAFVMIGPALTDRSKLIEMALHNPGPLFLQDVLKFFSAGASTLLVLALSRRIDSEKSPLSRPGALFGLLAILLLLANACVSLYATSQAVSLESGEQINLVIFILGVVAVFVNGLWYLFENLMARKNKRLPGGLTTLGMVIGTISLVPPLAILVLVLSLVWSVWLGLVFLKSE